MIFGIHGSRCLLGIGGLKFGRQSGTECLAEDIRQKACCVS